MLSPRDDLQRCLDGARPGQVIHLGEGEWRCKLTLSVPGVTLRGRGAEKTRILWDDYARKPDEKGWDLTTFRSWTAAVCADGVTLEDLAIVNDALRPEERGQEVALAVFADRFTMERCTLSSTQDTLFLGPLPDDLIRRYEGFLPDPFLREGPCRQVFRSCLIEGTVDFIFGCGQALFDRCQICSLPDRRGRGYLAAPAHSLRQEEGFHFFRCLLSARDGVAPGSVFLARPWRDYGLCLFEDCTAVGGHISPLGFDPWNDSGRDKTARFYESPPVPGRVPWVRPFPPPGA